MEAAVEVRDLRKAYGGVAAVDGVSFEIAAGEVFGIVGPNGAGKTTTVECVLGLRRPDAGRVRVLGLEPWRHRRRLAERVGAQLQDSALQDRLKVAEALRLFASLYRRPADWRALLDRWGLAELAGRAFGDLSGGQRQRLLLALALVGAPDIVVLDELTSGLDPHARRQAWDLVRDLRRSGVTVLLVSHFMDEAEALCDRVAVIDRGRLVAVDTPPALRARTEAASLEDAFLILTGAVTATGDRP
jgi:ABC-2 type transport system ATP-binding protein